MKRLVKSFLSLLAGIALFSGVTACKVNVEPDDPVVEIGLFLTQTPVTPVNGDVTVDVTVIPKKVQALKWLEGEKTIADFKDDGTELTVTDGTASFTVSKSGNYTVYAKANSKSEAVKTIFVEDVAFDVSGLISLSQSPASNVPTNAEVTVTALLSRSDAQTVKWAAGTHTVEDFATIRSTELTADEDGKYSFTVTENGTYTVYAQCNSKSKAVNVINVTNIDKVAPAAVTNLAANYVHSSRTINISWGNPAETDLDHAIVNVKNGNTVIVDDAEAKGNSYAVSDYTADNTTTVYISVKVADKAGNISGETTYNFVPKAIPEVQSITLDRYHISNEDTNRKITAIANISNMDALPEGEAIKIQVMDAAGNAKVNKTADVDKEAGTATIEFDAPSDKAEYTVRVKIGNNAPDTTHTVRLGVTAGPDIKLSYNGITGTKITRFVNKPGTVDVKITGTNLDLGPIYLYWKNEKAEQYGNPIEIDTSDLAWTATTGNSNSQSKVITIAYPKDEGLYYLNSRKTETKVPIDYYDSYSLKATVYGDVRFTDLYIPKVSVTKEDTLVTAVLSGVNFTSPEFDMTDIEFSCSEASITDNVTFKKVSENVIYAYLTIPGKIGDFEVTAKYKNSSKQSVLTVKDYSSIIVGSVVLSDNTLIPYDKTKIKTVNGKNDYTDTIAITAEQKESAVGLIGGFDCYGVPFVLGKSKSPNEEKVFGTKVYCETMNDSHTKRLSDGLDIKYNGSILKSVFGSVLLTEFDSEKLSGEGCFGMVNTIVLENYSGHNLETDYPALYYCKNYAKSQNLEGELGENWYMPSIYEVSKIYENRVDIEAILTIIGGSIFKTETGYLRMDSSSIMLYVHSSGSKSYSDIKYYYDIVYSWDGYEISYGSIISSEDNLNIFAIKQY